MGLQDFEVKPTASVMSLSEVSEVNEVVYQWNPS